MAVVEIRPDDGLGDAVYGLGDLMVELDISRGTEIARLSLSCLPRARQPVIMEVGPVMHLDDLTAWKVAAIINRREVRDYVDTSALLERRNADELIGMARRVDRGMEDEDIRMVGRVLDRMPDWAFAEYGVTSPGAVAALRSHFQEWPR